MFQVRLNPLGLKNLVMAQHLEIPWVVLKEHLHTKDKGPLKVTEPQIKREHAHVSVEMKTTCCRICCTLQYMIAIDAQRYIQFRNTTHVVYDCAYTRCLHAGH